MYCTGFANEKRMYELASDLCIHFAISWAQVDITVLTYSPVANMTHLVLLYKVFF